MRLIYQKVKKETLEEVLFAFYSCVKLPVQLLDENGVILLSYGGMNNYCKCFQKFLRPGESCAAYHQKAASRALAMGEPYTFTCHSELNHIVYPLVSNKVLLGSVLVGPFLMEEADMDMIVHVSSRYHLNTEDALSLYAESNSVIIIEPSSVTQVDHLLYHLFSRLITEEKESQYDVRAKSEQQSKINESIQSYKSVDILKTDHYPFDKEQLLMQKVRNGNVKEAKTVLNELLGYVLFAYGHSLQRVKFKSTELCSVLSRTVISAGANEENIMSRTENFLQILPDVHDIENLCFLLQELVEFFISQLFPGEETIDKDAIQSALNFMSQHYKEDISLPMVAEHVYLNPAYFSSLFKQSTGITFKEQLTNLRVEEARRMLVETNASIVDIALSCGFSNQSYFSKVFKTKTGFSPKSFRN